VSDRLLFLTFCWGAAGTTWLARLLNAHPDIFCMHAPMLPRFDHSQLAESTEVVDHVFGDASLGGGYPIVGFTHGFATEWYEALTQRYGARLRCLALTRHPIRRIQSTFNLYISMEHRLASEPTWRRMFEETYQRLRLWAPRAFPDDFESLAFYYACTMVNSITWEQRQSFPLFRLEDLLTSEAAVQQVVGHVSDGACQLPPDVIRQMQGTVVHSHGTQRLSPRDTYAGWPPARRRAYHTLVAGAAVDAYRRLGYELPDTPLWDLGTILPSISWFMGR
jgi:hypothetical protein